MPPRTPFGPIPISGRVVRAYSGCLPLPHPTPRHILKCEHLRPLPGESMQPYRAEPDFTHQIWIWYRLVDQPDKLHLLFRSQLSFRFHKQESDQDTDVTAVDIVDNLARLMRGLPQSAGQELFRHENSDEFWTGILEQFLSQRRRLMGIELQSAVTPEEEAARANDPSLRDKADLDLQPAEQPLPPERQEGLLPDHATRVRYEKIQRMVAHIFEVRKLTQADQRTLMALFSQNSLSSSEEVLINRIYDGVRRGLIKVVK